MRLLAIGLAGLVFGFASGATVAATYSGSLSDPSNTALVGSDLGAALFDNDADVANNVALYSFFVPVAGTVSITSTGFAAGGVDPYFTLFSGAGAGATFVASNFDQAFSTGGDFVFSALLGAGTYQIALGAFANQSFAENQGGTLGDGFIGLGEAYSLGNATYALNLSAVPEPQRHALMLLGLCACALAASYKRTQVRPERPLSQLARQPLEGEAS